jgi:redox-sensing transcriptional repressor
MKVIPHRTVGRLSLYRRILRDLASEEQNIYSHVLATKARVTAAQVRRDLMVVGYTGTPARGYSVASLLQHIEKFLFPRSVQNVALAGVGNIGRAILAFFAGRRPTLKIVASFDKSPDKCNRLFGGCPCFPIDQAEQIIRDHGITVGIIAVPAEEAQAVADAFVAAGIRGILNFARTPLRMPPEVYVENIDLAVAMDKVAFFARQMVRTDKALNAKGEH